MEMAEEEQEATTEEEKPSKFQLSAGMKKMLMIAGGVLVLVGGSVGVTLFFLLPGDEPAAGEDDVIEQAGQTAIYHNMRPSFVVTFMAGKNPRYLQADLTVVSREQKTIAAVITHAPLIRSRIVSLFTDQNYLTLQTDQGKLGLQNSLTELVNTTLTEEAGMAGVESVLLTNFVMQ